MSRKSGPGTGGLNRRLPDMGNTFNEPTRDKRHTWFEYAGKTITGKTQQGRKGSEPRYNEEGNYKIKEGTNPHRDSIFIKKQYEYTLLQIVFRFGVKKLLTQYLIQ